jgi:hypothetical protein
MVQEELLLSQRTMTLTPDRLWRLYVYYAHLSVSKEELVLSLPSLSSSSDGLLMEDGQRGETSRDGTDPVRVSNPYLKNAKILSIKNMTEKRHKPIKIPF